MLTIAVPKNPVGIGHYSKLYLSKLDLIILGSKQVIYLQGKGTEKPKARLQRFLYTTPNSRCWNMTNRGMVWDCGHPSRSLLLHSRGAGQTEKGSLCWE